MDPRCLERENTEGGKCCCDQKRVKTVLQKGTKQMRIKMYWSKEQQIRFFREQEEECHLWLTQNLHQRKMLSIMSLLEQMVKTRSWKAAQGIIEDGRCLVCHRHDETMKHLAAG